MDECAICYENMDHNGIIKLNCGHMFHKQCVIKINNNNCPLCRTPFDIKNLLNINKNIRILDPFFFWTNSGINRKIELFKPKEHIIIRQP